MAKLNAVKITLSSGKVVLLRELKISHTELAAQEVAQKAGGDANLMQLLMQKALIKNLLISVNGNALTATDRENLDDLFTVPEFSQILKVVNKLAGGDDSGKEPGLEIVSSGDN